MSGSNTSDDNVLGLNVDLIAAMRAWAEDKVEEDPADTGAADLAADLSVIDGEIGSSGFNVHWALGTAILSGGIKLGEQVSFTPTSETVTYQTPYQTVTGALGQDFQLDNPAGIGSYTVNATYAITGTLTSVLQAVFNAGLKHGSQRSRDRIGGVDGVGAYPRVKVLRGHVARCTRDRLRFPTLA